MQDHLHTCYNSFNLLLPIEYSSVFYKVGLHCRGTYPESVEKTVGMPLFFLKAERTLSSDIPLIYKNINYCRCLEVIPS